MMNKKLLAAAVAILSLTASAAQATTVANPDAPVLGNVTTTGSSLILSVWDITNNTAYSQVLLSGGSTGTPLTAAGFIGSNSFAGETLSGTNWSSFAGNESAGDNVVYQVEAGIYKNPVYTALSTVSTQADNPGGSSYATPADVVTGLQSYLNSTSRLGTFVTKLDNFETALKGGIGATGNDATALSSAQSGYNAGAQLAFNVAGGLNTTDLAVVSVGSNANFFEAATNQTGTTLTDQYLGYWNLTGNVLSYTTAPGVAAVPVPAAVWMMLSGLLGVLSLGRRKHA
jgi:hypothetical protein